MSHYDDEAEVEQLRRWWRENWKALAGGLVLGVAGIFGWEAWQDARTSKSEQASQIYEELKTLGAGQAERAAELGQKLIEGFSGTPYAAQAALLLARNATERQDWQAAQEKLQWTVNNSDDEGLRKIARLRLARVLWQQGRPDEALAQLEIEDGDAFAPLYQELRGDIQRSKGDRQAARSAYEKAMALDPAPASRELLQRKLDDLAGAAS